jgi:hypothetical protein
MALSRHQRHRLRFVDVRVDRQAAAAREVAQPAEERLAAALGAGRAERPGDARMDPLALAHRALDQLHDLHAAPEGLDRARQAFAHRRRHDFVPEGNRLDAGNVGDLEREYAADAHLLVRLQDRVDMLLVVRVDRGEVLDGGDATAQAFDRAEERSRADLRGAALRKSRRQRREHPELERNGFEAALQQYVVGVVVRIDEARDDELALGAQPLERHAGRQLGQRAPRVEVGAHALAASGDTLCHHEQVRFLGAVNVAIEIEHASAADEDRRGRRGSDGREHVGHFATNSFCSTSVRISCPFPVIRTVSLSPTPYSWYSNTAGRKW